MREPHPTVVAVHYNRPTDDPILYAHLQQRDGQSILVEVQCVESDGKVFVQALPRLVDGELLANFPFPSPFPPHTQGMYSSTSVGRKELMDIRVYRPSPPS